MVIISFSGLSCSNATTQSLLVTTATSLATLGGVDWRDLIKSGSGLECRIKMSRAILCSSGECAVSFGCYRVFFGCHGNLFFLIFTAPPPYNTSPPVPQFLHQHFPWLLPHFIRKSTVAMETRHKFCKLCHKVVVNEGV